MHQVAQQPLDLRVGHRFVGTLVRLRTAERSASMRAVRVARSWLAADSWAARSDTVADAAATA